METPLTGPAPRESGALTPDARGADPAGLRGSHELARIVLRPLASPLPLGFLALFVGTMLVSAQQLHWVPVAETHHLALGVLVLTVPLQLIACIYGFLCRDVIASTGLGVLAGTWATIGVTLLTSVPGLNSPGLGILLVVAAGALLVPSVAALSSRSSRQRCWQWPRSGSPSLAAMNSPVRPAGRSRPGSPGSSSPGWPSTAHLPPSSTALSVARCSHWYALPGVGAPSQGNWLTSSRRSPTSPESEGSSEQVRTTWKGSSRSCSPASGPGLPDNHHRRHRDPGGVTTSLTSVAPCLDRGGCGHRALPASPQRAYRDVQDRENVQRQQWITVCCRSGGRAAAAG